MGINASYSLIFNKIELDTTIIASAFVNFFEKKSIRLVGNDYLTIDLWKSNHSLFGVAITPITCFNLGGWKGEKNWALVSFSSFPKKAFGWEVQLSQILKTKIECQGVHDTSSVYTVDQFENGRHFSEILNLDDNTHVFEEINGDVRTPMQKMIECSCAGIESFAPRNYYLLKTFERLSIDGEQFLIFENDSETYFEQLEVREEDCSLTESEIDEDPLF